MEKGHEHETVTSFWDIKAGHPLNTEEQRQIKENLTGFFAILHEWHRKEKDRSEKDAEDQEAKMKGQPIPDM